MKYLLIILIFCCVKSIAQYNDGGEIISISDAPLKNSNSYHNTALEKLLNLKPIIYKWDSLPKKDSIVEGVFDNEAISNVGTKPIDIIGDVGEPYSFRMPKAYIINCYGEDATDTELNFSNFYICVCGFGTGPEIGGLDSLLFAAKEQQKEIEALKKEIKQLKHK